MWKILTIVLALSSNRCKANRNNKNERDVFMEKLESEFQGYEGRPMPPELAIMVTNHTLHNDDFEECMVDFSECMAVHKFYILCAQSVHTSKISMFPNVCEFEYRFCMDGDHSWSILPDSACSHLQVNITQKESSKDATFQDVLKWDIKSPENITEELETQPDVLEPKQVIDGIEGPKIDDPIDANVTEAELLLINTADGNLTMTEESIIVTTPGTVETHTNATEIADLSYFRTLSNQTHNPTPEISLKPQINNEKKRVLVNLLEKLKRVFP